LPVPQQGTNEWETVAYLEDGRLASNGLYYLVCKLQHRHTPGRLGRGKFYHLSWLPAARRVEIQHQLTRHPEVCTRLGRRRGIVTNYSSQPAGNEGWWVVDDWVGEKTLATGLHDDAWLRQELPTLLLDIAESLHHLHQVGIVFRELAPARVQIADDDGRAVLTDFELAKLLDGSPTVSSDWPEDPYRAPEIDGGMCTARADLYSFGKLVVAAVGGDVQASLTEQTSDLSRLLECGASKRFVKLLQQCIEPLDSRRPDDLQPLLQELRRWTTSAQTSARKA
jgi:serine/threonine protein kinase